jgi:hypothetical protein
MAEQDGMRTCGICSEPFKNGEVAVQAARWSGLVRVPGQLTTYGDRYSREKFWAHPVCLFSIAREAEGPASRVAAMPPEPPDDRNEALPEKRKPK